MGEDEEEAFSIASKNLEIHRQVLDSYGGQVIKELGDGILGVFDTVSAALSASLEIQQIWSETSGIDIRIGLQSGEVIFDHGDVFGDAVNIASRIQNIGIPGCILFSEKIHIEIPLDRNFNSVDLGYFELKNVNKKLRLFGLTNPPASIPNRKMLLKNLKIQDGKSQKLTIALIVAIAFFLVYVVYSTYFYKEDWIEEKSVAVLPFVNLNTDGEQVFFSDGLTEDIISHLSRINSVKVVSKSSVMDLKNPTQSLGEIGEKLGVKTILQGSVSWIKNTINIKVELIDVTRNRKLWAETFSSDAKEIFEIQKSIALEVMNALDVKLSEVDRIRMGKSQTINLNAYELYLKGKNAYYAYTLDSNILAVKDFKKAIQIDPNYALAYSGLADVYSQLWYSYQDNNYLDTSLMYSEKALLLDSTLAEGYNAKGSVFYLQSRYGEAAPYFEKAVALNPNYGQAMGNLGSSYFITGKLDQAIQTSIKSAELNPRGFISPQTVGWAYRILDQQDIAQEWLKKSLLIREDPDTYEQLALSLLQQGKREEALALIPKILSFSAENLYVRYQSAGMISLLAKDFGKAKTYFQVSSDLNDQQMTDYWFMSPIYLAYFKKKEKNSDYTALLESCRRLRLEAIADEDQEPILPLHLSAIEAIAGRKKESIEFLIKAQNLSWLDKFAIEQNPVFDSFRNDAGYTQLISGIKSEINQLNYKLENSKSLEILQK
jgi:TolB-like protein/Tfp pilus assembly protein PilF